MNESSSAGLLEVGEKSLEACLMRESIKQSKMMLDSITGILCHVEAESENIAEGTPKLFKLSMPSMGLQDPPAFPDPGAEPDPSAMPDPNEMPSGDPSGEPSAPEGMGGDQYIGVSVKRDADIMNVYICEGSSASDLKLSQHFKIEGSKTITKDGKEVGASKGEMRLSFDLGGITFGANVKYDAYLADEKAYSSELKVKLGGSAGAGMDMDMAQLIQMKVIDGGVSTVAVSDRGEMMGMSTKNSTIGKFDGDNGHVVGSFDMQEFSSNVQACVDENSMLVPCEDTKFSEGGDLSIAVAEVPAFLPADFAADAPSGFDCSAVEWGEAAEMDPASTKHKACEPEIGDMEAPGCFSGGDYASSGIEMEGISDEIREYDPEVDGLPDVEAPEPIAPE